MIFPLIESNVRARGAFALIVSITHLYIVLFVERYLDLDVMDFLLLERAEIAVGGFFVLSGAVLWAKYRSIDGSLRKLLMARFIRLLLPFLIAYLLLFLAYQLGAGGFAEKTKASKLEWGMSAQVGSISVLGLDGLIESIINQLIFGYNDQLFLVAWTIRYEIVLSLFIITVAWLSKRYVANKDLIAIIFACLLILTPEQNGVIAAFGVGVILSALYHNNKTNKFLSLVSEKLGKQLWAPILVILYISIVIFPKIENGEIMLFLEQGYITTAYLLTDKRYMIFGVGSLFIAVVAQKFKLFDYIGNRSYSLYLTHTITLQSLVAIAYSFNFKLNDPFNILVFIALYFWLSTIVASLFHQFADKPIQKIARKIEGRKLI